ncbi:Bacterio-opsin activator HTH domain protein [Sulfolobus islandicus L.S.2.15]|uniref:Bacterio-opsin activator HTH domain protein n=1 Tax=Saccharolobus islandicus (strain L.S.2.15 / Lassen \|nr:helix-turn-helix domain-containing protein [Sulfolobus islandicus]ACP34828.1 Bacterio-opsin activator HTH domain protein [Sulfolobus islandicus L.S.2.15]
MPVMREMNDNYALVYLRLKHEGCWSELTEYNNFMATTITAKPNRAKKFIIAYDDVKLNGNYKLKNFLRDLKKSDRVKEIYSINKINAKREVYRILLKESYENMVRGILDNYTVFDIKDLIVNGEERLALIVPVSEIIELKKDMESIGKVLKFIYKKIRLDDIFLSIFSLSKRERESMKLAYLYGFYEMPKKVTLDELARLLGISKPTIEDYIRRAERKIIKSFSYQLYYYDMLLEDLLEDL